MAAYVFTSDLEEEAAALPQVYSDIEKHYNFPVRTLHEIISCINGANSGNTVDGDPLQDYTGVGILDRLLSLEAGSGIKTVASVDMAFSVGAAGDRYLKMFHNGDGVAWAGLQFSHSGGIFSLLDNATVLKKLAIANGTGATHAITKAQLDALDLNKVLRRNTVITGALDANNLPAIVSINTGLIPKLLATATPFVFSVSNGWGTTGAVEKFFLVNADVVMGALTANSGTNYLYADVDIATSAVTYGATTIPYWDDTTFMNQATDTTQALLHFNDVDGSQNFLDEYNADQSRWTFTGAGITIDNVQSRFGGTSLTQTGNNRLACQDANLMLGAKPAWTVSFWFYSDSIAAGTNCLFTCRSSVRAGLYLSIGTNVITYQYSVSNTAGNNFLAGNTLGATTLLDNTWYYFEMTWDGTTCRAFLGKQGDANMVLDKSFTPGNNLAGANSIFDIGTTFNGSIYTGGTTANVWRDELYINTTTAQHTAVFAVPTVPKTSVAQHWFDPRRMKMFLGNTPDGYTQKQRVFLGQVDAGAATLSNAKTYAYNGETASPFQTYSNAALFTAQVAPMGTVNYSVDDWDAFCLSPEGDYVFGDVVDKFNISAGSDIRTPSFLKSRTALTFWASTGLSLVDKGAATVFAPTPANWLLRINKARRNY